MFPHPNRNVVLTPSQYSPSAPYTPQHTDKQALGGGGEGRGVCGVEVVDTVSTFRLGQYFRGAVASSDLHAITTELFQINCEPITSMTTGVLMLKPI